MMKYTSLCVILSPLSSFPLEETFFLATTQSTETSAAASDKNPVPGPHQTSWKSTSSTPWHVLFFLLFFFLFFFPCQSAEDRITAGTDTCCDVPAVQPSPLKVDVEKLLLLVLLTFLLFLLFFFVMFWLLLCVVSLDVLLEKVEKRVEILDLQEVDWIKEESCEVWSVSEMGCLNLFLGLLHFMCPVITGMV